MDPKVLAGDVINIVEKNMVDTTFAFDGADWSAADIRTLINEFEKRAPQSGLTLRGARVGGNITMKLGGGYAPYHENARYEGNIPVVAAFDFDRIEFDLKPKG